MFFTPSRSWHSYPLIVLAHQLMEKGPDLETGTNEKGKDKDTKTKGKGTGYRDRN